MPAAPSAAPDCFCSPAGACRGGGGCGCSGVAPSGFLPLPSPELEDCTIGVDGAVEAVAPDAADPLRPGPRGSPIVAAFDGGDPHCPACPSCALCGEAPGSSPVFMRRRAPDQSSSSDSISESCFQTESLIYSLNCNTLCQFIQPCISFSFSI